MREFIDLLENQFLLEDRTEALEAKFIPLIANYFKTGDENPDAPHRSASRHDLESVTTLYLPAKQAGAFSSARMDSEFHARKEDGVDPEYFFHPSYYTEVAKWAVHWIMSADPDPRKSFSTWLLTLYVKGKYRLEDLNRATDALEIYGDLVQRKRLPVEQRDINKVPDFAALAEIVRPYMDSHVESQNAAIEAKYVAESEILLDTPQRRVLKLNSMEAAQWFGRETEWCTAYGGSWGRYQNRGNNMYSHYAKDGPMFVIQDRENNLLYQFHAPSKQLMDVNDRSVNARQFSNRYPDVDAAFAAWNVKGKLVDTYMGLQFMWNPAGKVRAWLVASPMPNGFGMMWMLGMQNDTISVTVEKDKDGGSWNVTRFKCDEHFSPELRAKIIEILNRLKFQGVVGEMMNRGISFDKGKRKYIEFNQNPTLSRLKRQGKWVWKMASRNKQGDFDDDTSVYRLGDPDHAANYIAQVSVDKSRLGKERIIQVEVPDLSGKPKSFSFGGLKGLSAGIHDLLTVLSNRKDLILGNSGAVFRALDREHALDLAKTRPDWLAIPEYILFYGVTPAVKRKIVHYASEIKGLDTHAWMGDKLVVAKFDNVADFISECGTTYFDEMSAIVITNNRSFDVYDVYVSDYDMRDMLGSLKPKDLKRISDYMRAEYENEEEYDFDTVEGLLKAQEELKDDNLQRAFDDGKRSGDEVGAENQILDTIKSTISDIEALYFVVNGKLTKEWQYDAPMVFAPSAEQIGKEITDDDLGSVEYSGWVKGMNGGDPYKLSQPYNGWDECDDDAMKDRFADAIEEFLP